MKKVAFVIADLGLGGGQRVAITMANELAKEYKVSIIVFDDANTHYKAPSDFICLDCPSKKSIFGKVYNVFKRAYKLRKLLKKERYDYVYSFMETANFPTALAHPKAILSVHCNPVFLSSFESLLVRVIYPRAKHVIAVSDDVTKILRSNYKLKNVSRLYNPIDIEEITSLVDEPYQHPRPYIIALGRYNEMKRYDLLIDAYAQSKLQAECDLIIVGDGELREEIEAQIKRLKLEDKIILAGVQSNPFPYLAGAKFLALSSRTEAFPMVLIEALALECPIVATDCPTGPREIVQEGENGILVENKNSEALREGMDKLYFDEKLLAHFKKNALESIKHLSSDVIVAKLLSVN